ncbi:hypothetical protein Tco_0019797 [Tanacetum coccineum]
MVAYLEKSTENADFAEIVDFLNANPIRYALTVSPTIYVSCIEQFWSTAMAKTVNKKTIFIAKGSDNQTDPNYTSTSLAQPSNKNHTVPSSSQPKKTHRPRKVKRATKISQSSRPISLVADETITKEREDKIERSATTASSLEEE